MDTPPPATPIKRRLTAILAADAVGYSRQMGADEEGTLRVLAAQRTIIDRIIAAHDGRIVGTAGDSVLAEFASSVEAVRCAVEMQEALQTRNETLPESERLVFRVGVNLGDVMVDGANILGDGVNVAARLESIAEPGGICISSSVYDQIAGKLSLGFLDIGEQSLKNISRPIRVYRLDRSGAVGVAGQKPASGRARWLAAGGVAVVAVAALVAWQFGMLQRSPSLAGGGAVAIIPVPPTPPEQRPAPPSEETRMKLQIAEAERAKAEAELAKARAEAETARLRTQPARAQAADTKDAKPMQAAPTASPAAASAPAPTPAAAVAIPAPAATLQAPAVVASAAQATATNAAATVSATRRCGPYEELRPFTDELPAFIADGDIVIERGLPDAPGYLSLRGRPSADGKLVMSGTLVSVAQRTKGNRTGARFEGNYAEDHYTLIGHQGKRVCTIVVYTAPPR